MIMELHNKLNIVHLNLQLQKINCRVCLKKYLGCGCNIIKNVINRVITGHRVACIELINKRWWNIFLNAV